MKQSHFLLFLILFLIQCTKKEKEDEVPEEPTVEKEITIEGSIYNIDSFYIEKISPSLYYIYRQIKDQDFPLVIHTLELNRNQSEYAIETWIGKDSLRGLERPSAIFKRKSDEGKKVVAAINGGFYDMANGTPTGGEMISGVLIKSPTNESPVIAFDKNSVPCMDFMELDATVSGKNISHKFSGVNTGRLENYLVLYNSFFGKYTRTNEWGIELLLKPLDGDWEQFEDFDEIKCMVERVSTVGSMEIPKGKIILSGHGTAATFLRQYSVGDEITININLRFQSEKSNIDTYNLISTHQIVLNNNQPIELTDAISKTANPRTAIGYDKDKTKLYFMVVEGRSSESKGVTARQLSDIFLYLKASDAINLDGGGSSCMVVNQEIKNTLIDNYERPVTDGLFILEK